MNRWAGQSPRPVHGREKKKTKKKRLFSGGVAATGNPGALRGKHPALWAENSKKKRRRRLWKQGVGP